MLRTIKSENRRESNGDGGSLCTCIIVALSMMFAAQTNASFVDVSAARGIGAFVTQEGHGSGVAVVDFDRDGDLDIFAPQAASVPSLLYRNLGNGHFEEVAAQMGLADTTGARTALWLDYDGDRDWDLIVGNDILPNQSSYTLYEQRVHGFVDVTEEAGMLIAPNPFTKTHHWAGFCAGDINHDGYLDLYTTQWFGEGHLFLNTTTGGFQDISVSSGVSANNWGHQSVMADFNNDGWLDIFLAVDFDPNVLWINQQNNTFVNFAFLAGVDNAFNDMGVALGDYDNDGDFDLYITNIFMEDTEPLGPRYNVLYRNDTVNDVMSFVDVSAIMGVDDGRYGWGTTFIDYDKDTDLDLAATNGWRTGEWINDPTRFFVNPGNGLPFIESAATVGLNDTDWGSAFLAADFDRDGDLDLLQGCMEGGPLRLLDNQTVTDNKYLVVQLHGDEGNYDGIGAVIEIELGSARQVRQISAGGSYMGQEPPEAFFGLGDADIVDSVTVKWPGGGTTTLENVTPNQIIIINKSLGGAEGVPTISTWGQLVVLLSLLAVATVAFHQNYGSHGERL